MDKIIDDIDYTLMTANGPLGQNGVCTVRLDYVTYPYDVAFVKALDAYVTAAGARTIHVNSTYGVIKRHRSVLIVGTIRQVRRALELIETLVENRVEASSWVTTGTRV